MWDRCENIPGRKLRFIPSKIESSYVSDAASLVLISLQKYSRNPQTYPYVHVSSIRLCIDQLFCHILYII